MSEKDGRGRNKYPKRLALRAAGLSSGAWYRRTERKRVVPPGPVPEVCDEDLLMEIKKELSVCNFHGEGYKKISHRLHRRGVKAGKERVLKIMRENNLLSPFRVKSNGSSRPHDGRITTDRMNEMWGTDGKQFYTLSEGQCWLFSVTDHCNDEILGWHIAKKGDRFAAMEPVHQAVIKEYGSVKEKICQGTGLALRSDHGSQYDSKDFKNEMKFLGLDMSQAFVRSPECNGVIERFHRTLNEEVLQYHTFLNLNEAREKIGKFIKEYNSTWILHRLGLRSPIEHRKYLF